MKNIVSRIKKIFKGLTWLFKRITTNVDAKILLRKIEKVGWVLIEAFSHTGVYYIWMIFVRKCVGLVVEEYLWFVWLVLMSISLRKKLLKIFKK